MNLKENKEGYMREIGRKEQRERRHVVIILIFKDLKSNFPGTQISYFQFSRINKIVLLKSLNLGCLVMAAQTILTQTFCIFFLDGRKSKGIKNHLTS